MGLKGIATFAVLLVIAQAGVAIPTKTANPSAANRQSTTHSAAQASSHTAKAASSHTSAQGPVHPAASHASSEAASAPAQEAEGEPSSPASQPPRVTVVNPPVTPVPWTLHDKILWGAYLVLAIVGYIGMMLAVSLLKKIDRKTEYAEAAADAAAASAQAALLNAQAVIHSERPWILITVEPSRSIENSFTIMATNRGRTPGAIIATAEQTSIVIDEKHLPSVPVYQEENPGSPLAPIILLPGEFTAIKQFCRDDVRGLCDSEERFKRIGTWEEKVFLYGKITYRDLIAPPADQVHETNWCCWYIHGRQNSGLVMAGPIEYHAHT
jgi:hypothetical protein